MELTITYVLSQIFVIINAALLMATYQLYQLYILMKEF